MPSLKHKHTSIVDANRIRVITPNPRTKVSVMRYLGGNCPPGSSSGMAIVNLVNVICDEADPKCIDANASPYVTTAKSDENDISAMIIGVTNMIADAIPAAIQPNTTNQKDDLKNNLIGDSGVKKLLWQKCNRPTRE